MNRIQFGYGQQAQSVGKSASMLASQTPRMNFPQGSDTVQFGNSRVADEKLLKNGGKASLTDISSVMVKLQKLQDKGKATAIFALVKKCRSDDYALPDPGIPYGVIAELNGLMQADGRVEPVIRDIVVSAAEGEDLELTITNPVQSPEVQ